MIDLSPSPLVGTRIAGRYRCVALLGSGGMGQVFLVQDELEHGRPLALKLLRPDAFRPDWVELLKTEFAALARLRHPGLVEVYEFGVDPVSGLPYFTLEPLRGTGLLKSDSARSTAGLLEIIFQTLKALAFIHGEGFLHYDVKPSNVFVTEHGQVKLMDFALTGSPGRSALHKGTPAYAAPEMIRLEPVDRRLDLYSFGATLYHVLSGHPPFSGPLTEVLRGHLYRVAPPLGLTNDRAFLERFVFRLLAKRPDDRYFSAEHAMSELAQLSQHRIATPATEESYLLTSKIIGREAEMKQLLRPIVDLESPTPSPSRIVLTLVSGESGLGKTRLMRELEVEAQLRSLPFAAGHCAPRGLLPLQALREALRLPVLDAATRFPELLQSAGSDLEELVPGLRTQLAPSFEREASAQDGKALAERIGRFLLQYSTRQTLVLHLGDLQWAGEPTVQTIELLLRELTSAPGEHRLTVYASFRPEESQGQPWGAALQRLAGAAGVERLELEPLGASSVSRMLASMLGTSNLDGQVAARVAAMTRGNPLFVEETLRYLVDWGLLIRRGARLELLANMEDLPLPTTMAQALSMAFEGLAQDEIDLVQALAVLGRPASASLLAAILQSEPDEVHRRARSLMPRHFLSRSWTEKDYVYALRHAQFSHTLYERLSPVPKARLHAAVAEVLEAAVAAAADTASVLELAVHFAEGISARTSDPGYRERAFRWCVEAGNLAARTVSYAKAAELLDRAQRLAMRGGEPYRQNLLDVTIALVMVLDTLDDEGRKHKELQRVERLVKMMQQPVLASGGSLAQ